MVGILVLVHTNFEEAKKYSLLWRVVATENEKTTQRLVIPFILFTK